MLKAHRTLKDYCTRKLASIERDDNQDDAPKNKFFKILNWVNKKLQKWSEEKVEEAKEPNEEKNVVIYPKKLNLVIFPPSVEAASEAVEEDVEEEPITAEEFNQDLWDETNSTPSRRSLRMVKEESKTEKPTFSEFLKNNLNFDSIFAKTTKAPQRRNEDVKKKTQIVPFVPIPDLLKNDFEEFEKNHKITPLPILESRIVPKPSLLEKIENNSPTIPNVVLLLYLVPVILMIAVLVLLWYLIAYVRKKTDYLDCESQERLLNVRIEQEIDEESIQSSPKELSKLIPKGEKKTRRESYEDD